MNLLETIEARASSEYSSFLAAQPDSISVGDFVYLYGQTDLPERNETYEVQTYLADWFAIGDDGGGTALSCGSTGHRQFTDVITERLVHPIQNGLPIRSLNGLSRIVRLRGWKTTMTLATIDQTRSPFYVDFVFRNPGFS